MRSTLGCMLLFCVAGARLWKHDGCVAWPCHATHMRIYRKSARVTCCVDCVLRVQFVIQIAAMIFCILCPNVSQCPERTKKYCWQRLTMSFVSVQGRLFPRTKLLNVETKNLPGRIYSLSYVCLTTLAAKKCDLKSQDFPKCSSLEFSLSLKETPSPTNHLYFVKPKGFTTLVYCDFTLTYPRPSPSLLAPPSSPLGISWACPLFRH